MEIEITKITSKGQVVIPQDIRDKAGIEEGEKFFVYESGDSIILKRTKNFKSAKSMEEFDIVFKNAWETAKARNISREDVEKEIKSARDKKR
ncbi:MAG: AbrB/MazE/SpoVT family DNA-binding domain-containing protein [Nanoarchaeota archaeon]